MKLLRTIRNYIFYCGIEKDEFKSLKKEAYKSNFASWKLLHCLMTTVFGFLFINSLFSEMLAVNRIIYMIFFIYSTITTVLFFVLKKDSFFAQLLIYLSISMLFLFGCLITENKPNSPATTFIVLLLITPMFMIDKPYFMAIELAAASAVFLIWMYYVKPPEVWKVDLVNILIYLGVGIVIHIIANSVRIKEFVLTKQINIQKDIDDLTGIKNKGALTREINDFLLDKTKDKGVMILLDIDHFKSINDTYGHDIGDSVIKQFSDVLTKIFTNGEVVGRFGGDEFIVFIKNTDDKEYASNVAKDIITTTKDYIKIPDLGKKVCVSLGIAVYNGVEKNYSEIFKKADIALYNTKMDRSTGFNFYKE